MYNELKILKCIKIPTTEGWTHSGRGVSNMISQSRLNTVTIYQYAELENSVRLIGWIYRIINNNELILFIIFYSIQILKIDVLCPYNRIIHSGSCVNYTISHWNFKFIAEFCILTILSIGRIN